MLHHKHKNALTISLRASVALGSLAALSGTAAHAELTQFDAKTGSSALLTNGVTTAQYSLGNAVGTHPQVLPSGYSVTAGTNTVTFISTVDPASTTPDPNNPSTAFEGFRNQVSPALGNAFDFALNEHLIDTFDPTGYGPSGPLKIQFSTPVGSFGFKSQDAASDYEQFTVSAYNISNTLLSTGTPCSDANNGHAPCSFQTEVIDNLNDKTHPGNGKSLFLGASSTMADISYIIINDYSTASDPTIGIIDYHGNSNDFYTGPLTVGDPVPEASSMTGFGLGTLFFGGLFLVSRKRKSTQTSPV